MIANQNYMMGSLHKPIIQKWREVVGMYQINCWEKFGKSYIFIHPSYQLERKWFTFISFPEKE
jgi:hypothetical protein